MLLAGVFPVEVEILNPLLSLFQQQHQPCHPAMEVTVEILHLLP